MELSGLRRRVELRSLPFDLLVAACVAVPMGGFITLAFVWLSYVYTATSPSLGVVAVVGSAASMAVLLSYGAKEKPRALARVIGAEAGLLTFLWILFTPGPHHRIWFARDIMPTLPLEGVIALGSLIFGLIASICVSVGLLGCDRAWLLISSRVGRRDPIG